MAWAHQVLSKRWRRARPEIKEWLDEFSRSGVDRRDHVRRIVAACGGWTPGTPGDWGWWLKEHMFWACWGDPRVTGNRHLDALANNMATAMPYIEEVLRELVQEDSV